MTTTAAIAAALTEALEAAAAEADANCGLVSVNFSLLAPPAPGQARASVERKTRTLIFMNAAYVGADGVLIASAASVHRIGD